MRLGTIAFLAGVLLLQTLPLLPSIWWCTALVPALVLWRRRPLRPWLLFGAGFLWALLHSGLALEHTLEPAAEGVDLVAVGRVDSIPEPRAHSVRFEFRVSELRRNHQAIPAPARLRLSWYGHPPPLQAGARWQLKVRLKRPHGFMNPGGFDYEGWLFRHGDGATGYVRRWHGNHRLAPAPWWSLNRLRQQLAVRLDAALGESANRGVIKALAVGERSAISPRQWTLLTATGTNHLLAISGLHVGLVAGLAFFLAQLIWSRSRRLTLHVPASKAGAVAALGGALSYAALAGFSLPTQRALIMLMVGMGALLSQRGVAPSRTLALALLAVLLLDPLAVLEPGMWLSFGAVAAILYGMGGRLAPGGLWWRFGRVQWLVAVALLPLTLLFFQRSATVAPLVNLLAVPWVGLLVVPLVLLAAVALGPLPSIGHVLLVAADHLLNVFWAGLRLAAALPAGQWYQHAPPLWAVAAGTVGVVLLLAPRGLPGRAMGAVLLLPLILTRPAPQLRDGDARFTLLDVGQGLSAVVHTRRHVLVYDTGPRFSASFDTGAAVVVPFLRQQGVQHIDRVIVSHGDNDHIGGFASLHAALPIDGIQVGVPGLIAGASACLAGERWIWDGVRFEILHPPPDPRFHRNDRSCVLRVSTGGSSVLITGDIERRSEAWLLRHERKLLAADILVVPHHGSRTSSTPGFVHAVHPRYALFAVGYRNRFGFPRPEVTQRYRALGAQLLDTAGNGAIRFDLTPKGAGVPVTWRQAAQRYWNRPGRPLWHSAQQGTAAVSGQR